ncbi:MAG: hypothetical protein ACLU3I_14150 [Acutalibacteraceae bacterium]
MTFWRQRCGAAHLTPYDPEEAAEDGIGCGRCCALCGDHSCEDDYD